MKLPAEHTEESKKAQIVPALGIELSVAKIVMFFKECNPNLYNRLPMNSFKLG